MALASPLLALKQVIGAMMESTKSISPATSKVTPLIAANLSRARFLQ
jgi:hypothetical protein